MGVQLQHNTATEVSQRLRCALWASVVVLCCSWTPILSIDLRIFYCVFTHICAWLLDPANVGPPFYQPSLLFFMFCSHIFQCWDLIQWGSTAPSAAWHLCKMQRNTRNLIDKMGVQHSTDPAAGHRFAWTHNKKCAGRLIKWVSSIKVRTLLAPKCTHN